ncbi:Ferrous iron transport protein A [Candidatus Magnetaquicoccaceae bacterium FCR-1]|uniref:Ferrous iron transport protein A n=1 Tax=Candidatus Magnetaquiglobus chichijimensis TaxID=3141448 RepID=A0ABQ0CAH6_9PROT
MSTLHDKSTASHSPSMTLDQLPVGQKGRIEGLKGDNLSKKRLMAMGLVRGKEIALEIKAPLGDPRIYTLLGYRLSIRNDDARNVLISSI